MAKIDDEATQLREYWQDRDTQMMIDREIIHLVQTEPDRKDVIKWKSNEPKVFYDTAVALISSYPIRFRHPLSMNFKAEERDKMNKAERFDIGIFRNLDARQVAMGRNFWLREFAYWMLSGWYATFVAVQKDGDDVKFIADNWDPITVYPEWEGDKLVKCIRTYEVDKRTAMAMALGWKRKGLEFAATELKDRVRVINYWRDDRGKIYNAIKLGDSVAKNLTEIKNLDRIPIFVGAIGVPERTSPDWQRRWGENIIAANRDMYSYEDLMSSLMAKIMLETSWPEIVSKTQTGRPVLKENMKGHGEEIALKRGEEIGVLRTAEVPEAAINLFNWVGRQRQKGSLPDVVYGGLSIELSGFAISQLMAAIRYKLAPYLTTMEKVIGLIAAEFETQYKKGNYPQITLSTTDPASVRKGLFFIEDFSPSDVPEARHVEVTIPITSAIDKTQQILFARQALQPPQILSRETLWEDYLDVQDSEQEYIRIIQDQMLDDAMVRQIAVIEQLRQRENLYRSQGKNVEADALKRYIMMLEMKIGMRQGVPTKEGGVSPETMPPEMINSPDVKGAIAGKPPPSPTRPSQAGELTLP